MKLKQSLFICFSTALLLACLLLTGCNTMPNPDLSLASLEGYEVAMSPTIKEKTPGFGEYRPLYIQDSYSSILFGLSQAKRYKLAPDLKTQLGNERKVSHLRIKTYSNFWQAALKICTLYLFEPRTIKVTGKIWLEK